MTEFKDKFREEMKKRFSKLKESEPNIDYDFTNDLDVQEFHDRLQEIMNIELTKFRIRMEKKYDKGE